MAELAYACSSVTRQTNQSSIRLGLNPRILRPERVHDAPQAQIQPRGHERRRDRQADNLDQEAILRPLVVVAHEAARVADDLENRAGQHGHAERQRAPRGDVDEQEADDGYAEERGEGDVCAEAEAVVVVGGFDGAHEGGGGAVDVLAAGSSDEGGEAGDEGVHDGCWQV